MDYRVCYSGQVTHVTSPPPTLGSKEREMEDLVKTSPDKTTESQMCKQDGSSPSHASDQIYELLTAPSHLIPRHQEFFVLTGTSERAAGQNGEEHIKL